MRIGFCLADAPRLLQEILLSVLLKEKDFEVVQLKEKSNQGLIEAARLHRLDLLILSLATNDPDDPPIELLYARAHLKVFGLLESGEEAYLYSLEPRSTRVSRLAPEALVAEIRRAGAPGG